MNVTVNFDYMVDWEWFQWGLNHSLPEDAVVDFRYSNPLRHDKFCPFILGLHRNWTMETSLVGPGLACLMAYSYRLTDKCEEIIAKFGGNAHHAGLIPWLGQAAKLSNAGYNTRAEVPRKINPNWLRRYVPGEFELQIDVVQSVQTEDHPRGFQGTRSCDGELALIWKDGKYYSCPWCLTGGMRYPVYSYGEFGDRFEKCGQQECHLRWCPLER